jgi:hypothetical protein
MAMAMPMEQRYRVSFLDRFRKSLCRFLFVLTWLDATIIHQSVLAGDIID